MAAGKTNGGNSSESCGRNDWTRLICIIVAFEASGDTDGVIKAVKTV